MKFNSTLQRLLPDTYLYEPEDGKGRSAVVTEYEAHDAEELSIEAAVTQTEQEAAEQRQLDTEQQHTQWNRVVGKDGCTGNVALKVELFVPGFNVGLQICSSVWGYRSVAGNVEENQVKSNKVGDESQQHHRISPEAAAFVQHAKNAPSWSDKSKDGRDKSRGRVPAVSQMCHHLCNDYAQDLQRQYIAL